MLASSQALFHGFAQLPVGTSEVKGTFSSTEFWDVAKTVLFENNKQKI